ncbi:MAG: phospholipid carrier-dependent glycosyltransferase [Planctomycetaceae bacterium]
MSNHRRFIVAAVIGLLSIHAALLAYSATRHSPTLNEPGHLVAGLANWEFGRFELYRVNPPLVKMIAALPVLAAGYEADWTSYYDTPGARPVFSMSADFMTANQERSLWLITLARWACLPISLTGGLFCFLWSREFWQSETAGLVSLTLWCFEPNILAHGELITPDCAATTFGLGAGWLFWRWLKQPSWGRVLAAGVLLGLAELSKMTWVILYGLWPALWIVWILLGNRQTKQLWSHVRQQAVQLIGILLLGLYVLNLGYGFEGTGTSLKEFQFVSTTLTGLEESGEAGNRFAGTWTGEIPVPFPAQYVLGMDVQRHDFEDYGQMSYLNGEWQDGGWWYYYLYGLAVKTPHGTQCLLLATVLLLCTTRWTTRSQVPPGNAHPRSSASTPVAGGKSTEAGVEQEAELPGRVFRGGASEREERGQRDLLILLTPAMAVLVLVSSQTEFNHHLRYVLPIFGFLFVLAGLPGRWCERLAIGNNVTASTLLRRAARGGVVAALLFTVISTLGVYPHQLAYFNELSGGPENGYRHLAHSNVDWGQDLLLVREWMRRNNVNRDEIRFETYYPYPAAPIIGPQQPDRGQSPRIEIVSANFVTQEDRPWKDRRDDDSTERIGHSLWAFQTKP